MLVPSGCLVTLSTINIPVVSTITTIYLPLAYQIKKRVDVVARRNGLKGGWKVGRLILLVRKAEDCILRMPWTMRLLKA